MSKNKIHDLIMIILGNFVVACSVSFFILPNNILTGGVAGVVVALHPVLPIDTVLMIDGLTIGLFILGALFIRKAVCDEICDFYNCISGFRNRFITGCHNVS